MAVGACLQIVDLSRAEEGAKHVVASSNAMTILNFLGFSFAGRDLSHIKINGSILCRGMFEGTSL